MRRSSRWWCWGHREGREEFVVSRRVEVCLEELISCTVNAIASAKASPAIRLDLLMRRSGFSKIEQPNAMADFGAEIM
jgi:hypothetical protein